MEKPAPIAENVPTMVRVDTTAAEDHDMAAEGGEVGASFESGVGAAFETGMEDAFESGTGVGPGTSVVCPVSALPQQKAANIEPYEAQALALEAD